MENFFVQKSCLRFTLYEKNKDAFYRLYVTINSLIIFFCIDLINQ